MTPAEIKKTRLYRTMAPCVRKEDREELARMLSLIPGTIRYGVNFDETTIDRAFVWSQTPQGVSYWATLNTRLMMAGHFD